MNILVFSNLFPNKIEPYHGVFIKKRIEQYVKFDHKVQVLVPLAYFPFIKKYQLANNIKGWHAEELYEDFPVLYFKYLHIPKIGMLLQPFLIFFFAYFLIKQFKKTFKIDIIDAHYLYPDGVAAAFLAKWFKLPLVLSARGSDINVIFKYRIPKNLVLWSLKTCSSIVSVSQKIADSFIENNIEKHKIQVIPNGVDHTRFHPIKVSNRSNNKVKRILMVGHLIEQKGQHLLVQALRNLECTLSNYKLIAYLIGEGPLTKRFESNNAKHRFKNRIVLVGPVLNEKLINWYNKVDFLCLLSESEGSPNVVLEAMSCGLPVLATDVGDLKEIIKKDIGIVLENRTVTNIAQGISEMINHPWDRSFISNYSRRFSWENVGQKTNQILTSAYNREII